VRRHPATLLVMIDSTPNGLIMCDGLDRFFAGDLNPAQLQHWFLNALVEPYPDESSDDGALWKGVITLLALYSVGDFDRDELELSLQQLLWNVDAGARSPAPPMLLDRRTAEIIQSGRIPWPLEQIRVIERTLRRQGIQDT
jgi:hypothetical protein